MVILQKSSSRLHRFMKRYIIRWIYGPQDKMANVPGPKRYNTLKVRE